MALLNATEYVNNYVIPKLFPPDNNLTAEQKQAMIRSWGIILSHIEENMAITTPPFTVKHAPDLPVASTTGGITVSFPSGSKLSGTGGDLAQKFINAVNPSIDNKPQLLQNLTNNFNLLFAHIVEKAEVDVSNIPHAGTVTNGSSSFPYGNVKKDEVKGQII